MLREWEIASGTQRLRGSDAAARQRAGSSGGEGDKPRELARRAAAVLKVRQLRNRMLGRALFGEPAWDMLLALYVANGDGSKTTVSGLASGSDYPHTTALRWLQTLEAERLVERRRHPTDKRIHFVELTAAALDALDRLFAENPIV